jgi:hypothetical protein
MKTMLQEAYGHRVFCEVHAPVNNKPVLMDDVANCWTCINPEIPA